MKIKGKALSRKKILIIVAVVLAVAFAGAAAYIYKQSLDTKKESDFGSSSTDSKEPTDEQKKAGDTSKKETIDEAPQEGKPHTPGDDVPSPQPQAGKKTTFTTTLSAVSQNGPIVQIRALIETVTSTGTCTLTLMNGNTTVTKTAGVQPMASSTTCQGFDISTSELSKGDWRINLTFENATSKGNATGTVRVS